MFMCIVECTVPPLHFTSHHYLGSVDPLDPNWPTAAHTAGWMSCDQCASTPPTSPISNKVSRGVLQMAGRNWMGCKILGFTDLPGNFMEFSCHGYVTNKHLGLANVALKAKPRPRVWVFFYHRPPTDHQGLLHLEALLKFQIIRRDAPGVAQGAHRHLQQRHQQTWFKDRCHVVPQPINMVCCFLNDHGLMKKYIHWKVANSGCDCAVWDEEDGSRLFTIERDGLAHSKIAIQCTSGIYYITMYALQFA